MTRKEEAFYHCTRLFFVTGSADDNEELHETLEDAREYIQATKFNDTPEIWACIVRNAYTEENGEWNYEDFEDTFTPIKQFEATQ